MTLTWPWMLLTLPAVAAVAVVILRRPRRPVVAVASLRLWREALASAAATGRRGLRRIHLSWMLILLGCILAALALARPEWRRTEPVRRVSLLVCPSAELGPQGQDALTKAADHLLQRLRPGDRVQLILPNILGGAGEWIAADSAADQLANLPILPARWDQLTFPQAAADSDVTIALAPGDVPGDAAILLPTDLPPVTIEHVGAMPLADGNAQVFVSLRSNEDGPQDVACELEVFDQGGQVQRYVQDVTVLAGESSEVVLTAPGGQGLAVHVDQSGRTLTSAFLVCRTVVTRTVAMVGTDHPMVRRFVHADEMLTLVADVAEADLVIAIDVAPPAGKPALVFYPPSQPRIVITSPVRFDSADMAVDDVVLAGVDFAGVAVRHFRGLTSRQPSSLPLVVVDGWAVILRNREDLLTDDADRRITVTFDVALENTNWTLTESFVVFMANAVRWLAPGGTGQERYDSVTPLEAPRPGVWTRVDGQEADGPLLQPGHYTDADGRLHAVSLTGLQAGQPDPSVEQQIAAIELPVPAAAEVARELWPMLALAAMVLWMGGWLTGARTE